MIIKCSEYLYVNSDNVVAYKIDKTREYENLPYKYIIKGISSESFIIEMGTLVNKLPAEKALKELVIFLTKDKKYFDLSSFIKKLNETFEKAHEIMQEDENA